MKTAAATFVQVTIEDMDKVIQRGFRALHPRKEKSRWGEILYILTPDEDEPHNVIRVQSSIFSGREEARGEGEDSIRVTIINTKTDRPIAGKMQRVHRTQNWRDNLRGRIEDAMETFEDSKEERQKAEQASSVREEQKKYIEENPQEARSEQARQISILETLANSRSPNAHIFQDMLNRIVRYKGLLSPKQLAWAEREHQRFR